MSIPLTNEPAKRTRWTRNTISLTVAATICFGVLYSRAVRRISLGEQFRYIPREGELLVATGDVGSLWKRLEQHFGRLFRSGGPFDDVVEDFRKSKLTVAKLTDLESYGLDIHRGLLVSIYRPTGAFDCVAVVPIVDEKKMLQTLTVINGDTPPEEVEILGARGEKYEAHRFRDFFAAFPESGLAVLSTSEELMRRSLTRRKENLDHAANNDALFDSVRRVLRGPLLTGANIFVHWESRTAPFDERAAVLRFTENEIRLEGEVELAGGTLRVVDNLRRRSTAANDWLGRLPAGTLGVAVVQDDQLPHYKQFVSEQLIGSISPRVEALLREATAGLEMPRFDRIAVALTDYEDGLPDFVVGIWGNRQQLEGTLQRAQQVYRQARDRGLLENALAKYDGPDPPTLANLMDAKLLDPEDDSLFHRYPIKGRRVGQPTFRSGDFTTPLYTREIAGHRVRFLAPPLRANDLAVRTDLKNADQKMLSSDRYRLATVFDQGTLWIATDVGDLESVLNNRRSAGTEASVLSPPRRGTKLHASLDVERVVALGMLSPGSELGKLVRGGLDELQGFSSFEADATPSLLENRLRFSATLRREVER